MPCWRDPERQEGCHRLVMWRMEGASLKEIGVIDVGGVDYEVMALTPVTGSLVLMQLRFARARDDGDKCNSANDTSGDWQRGPFECILYDVGPRRIVARAAAPGSFSLPVAADGGRYVALLGRDAIELRSLPSLAVVKQNRHNGYPSRGAVSSDGRYVAFGLEQLELWDTDSNRIHILDEMDSKTILSDTFRHRDDPVGDDAFGTFAAIDQRCLGSLRFAGEGPLLAAVSHDGVFSLWDVSKCKCLRRDRMATVEYLGIKDVALSRDRKIEDILADLKSGEKVRVTRATRRLCTGTSGTPNADIAKALEALLVSPDSDFVRADAAKALEKWSTPAVVPGLIKAVNDRNPMVRWSAIKTLIKYRAKDAIQPISTKLDDVFTRTVAAEFLKAVGPAAEPAVVGLLENRDPAVRREACSVLKAIGTKESISALEKAANDSDSLVKKNAIEAVAAVKERQKTKD